MSEVIAKGKAAKIASYQLIGLSTEQKNEALEKIAMQLVIDRESLLIENQKDLEQGRLKGFSESTLDRIMLNPKRIDDIAAAIRLLIELKDPIGEKLEMIEKENGLLIKKLRVPIGVIGMIYEARPNVTIDAATLSLKTGNAVILRGSSSAKYSNMALVSSIHEALKNTKIPVDAVQLIEDTSRETAKELFHLKDYLDVLIPRGGKNLIETVIRESTVPVLETGAGNCHIFIDETADLTMVENIVLNGKTQRPSVCNAIESLLIHEKWFEENGKSLLAVLNEKGIEIYGDEAVCNAFPEAKTATEEDWSTEYLALKISVKTVSCVSDAIEHINRYGTNHSEAILTKDEQNAAVFLNKVDAAAVYHNASTRFTDGFEFGYGAEIGISTQKLHARGPMGLPALTSSKYFIYGEGQIRE
ncbi:MULTISPECIES: glutamate-5-semialdehyde dehydrogenase [unclassified Peribacillus]|uniref:glutamate-5-semialdehyde dehydrogenase n=1 Tax=unclassified Peribacillus TaxID=2675266 RepID=UPI0019122927|nr:MULTISPECIES: glutamate-5-semialdehyde dehydrogenase [unclassified Peribacillus]MBK5442282.1 glutamate-5-semialdehyde dehydrogenase [Peribacillus sp. TH24]MBK5462967.1 glutamate-5-semialdehyde dehydrogenase [Peribacillus sp. TH27]MBK5483690.1 glutamate-5-semialdehyde dehydrogenase [Peribacillus sp. TH16]MBK5501150.1 glutamate-5-semialdehyde dehydrogenase [Peribacillus sp. TH14]WMX53881.1 glutamate-5-semialdehyde dehydrogenase [Peribacillus sp. R9-11]